MSMRIPASVSMFPLARHLRWVTGGSRKCDPSSRRTDTVSIAMTQRFVVLDDWTNFWGSQPALERLRQRGEVTIHTTPAANEDDVVRRLANVTVLLANRERTQLSANVLRSAVRLELLAQSGRISPNVDIEAASERGVALVAAGGQPGSDG